MKKNMLKKGLVFGIVLLFIGMFAIPVPGIIFRQNYDPPEVVYVDDDYNSSTPGWGYDHFDNIQDGIMAVQINGTVNVYSGAYYGYVEVFKSLKLIGEQASTTIIDGKNLSDVVRINEDWVSISGFTITNGSNGITCSANNIQISGNIISNNFDWGVWLSGQYNVVSGNSIDDNGHSSGGTIGAAGGIYLPLAFNCKINKNNIRNNKEANAFFFKSILNLWILNYWDRPRLLPYPIFGVQAIIPPIFWFQFDWRPALKLNEIP